MTFWVSFKQSWYFDINIGDSMLLYPAVIYTTIGKSAETDFSLYSK